MMQRVLEGAGVSLLGWERTAVEVFDASYWTLCAVGGILIAFGHAEALLKPLYLLLTSGWVVGMTFVAARAGRRKHRADAALKAGIGNPDDPNKG